MEETFTPNQIVEEATLWFMTFNGTYARLLKRTKAEGKRAFVVFCDQALHTDYRDVKGKGVKDAFINAFMSSSTIANITSKDLVQGSVEYKELVDAYLGE
tara:strand:+ start:3451 stop:3750 length:300 start_codon:yes stop_codon:yes gene_type:complete